MAQEGHGSCWRGGTTRAQGGEDKGFSRETVEEGVGCAVVSVFGKCFGVCGWFVLVGYKVLKMVVEEEWTTEMLAADGFDVSVRAAALTWRRRPLRHRPCCVAKATAIRSDSAPFSSQSSLCTRTLLTQSEKIASSLRL